MKQRVVGAREAVYDLFIGNTGHDDSYVHAPPCRQRQGAPHGVVQNEIGGKNIDVFFRAIDDIEIDRFRHADLVDRRVVVGLQTQASLFQRRRGMPVFLFHQIFAQIFLILAEGVPEIEKHHRHGVDRAPFEAHDAVLPVPEPLLLVDIFVGKIDAAREPHLPVDDENFAVITVVHAHGEHGNDRVESHTANVLMQALQIFFVLRRQGRHAPEVVVDHADLHACLRFLQEDFQHFVPHFAVFHDEIVEQNKLLRLFEFFQNDGKGVLAALVIIHLAVAVDGEGTVLHQIPAYRVAPIFAFERRHFAADFAEDFHVFRLGFFNLFIHAPSRSPLAV